MTHEILSRHEEMQGSSDRGFGLVFSGFFALLAVLAYRSKLPFALDPAYLRGCPWLDGRPEVAAHALDIAFAAASLLFLFLALAAPKVLGPLNRAWFKFGLLLHKIVSPLVLGVLFFGLFTPLGLLMRLFGGDPLRLRRDAKAASYWIERTPPGPAPDSLKDQF